MRRSRSETAGGFFLLSFFVRRIHYALVHYFVLHVYWRIVCMPLGAENETTNHEDEDEIVAAAPVLESPVLDVPRTR